MLDWLIITLIILLVTRWFQMKPFFWKDLGIPYSVPLPILGSTITALYKSFLDLCKDLYNRVGDNKMYGFHFFNTVSVMIKDPELLKKFTITEADSFMSHGVHSEQSYDPLSKGLFFSEGQQWKRFREKMTPYLTPSRIKAMLPMIHPIGDDFIKFISDNGKSGPVDVQEASLKFSVDVIMSIAFGLKPDSFRNPNSYFFGLQRELVSFVTGLKIVLSLLNPYLYGLLGLSLLSKSTTKKIEQLMADIIDQRLKGIGNRPDFLQGMVDLMKQEENSNDHEIKCNSDGTIAAKFDRFGITGQCMMMYAAGTETTGNTIAFLLYELALNPQVQEIAREEINAMLEKTNGEYGYEDLHSLDYVHMVIKESLRKYPIAMVFGRKCTRKFEFKGVTIPVGSLIVIAPICIHYDPKHFPDPDKFIPERFSDESNIIQGTYLPFGSGPRTCIGIKMAQTEIALALCKLLPKFRLSKSNKTTIPMEFSNNPTLSPKNGIWLNVEEIK